MELALLLISARGPEQFGASEARTSLENGVYSLGNLVGVNETVLADKLVYGGATKHEQVIWLGQLVSYQPNDLGAA
ncbi:MAG: hypothetical protein WAV90_15830 [Gordonia amarae]